MDPERIVHPQYIEIIVQSDQTQAKLMSDIPEDLDTINRSVEHFSAKNGAPDIEVDLGVKVEQTPDGEVSSPVLIWSAKWTHEKGSLVPVPVPYGHSNQ